MENVMDMARGPLMEDVFARIGTWMHESPDGVKRGFESAVPLSIAGLAEGASTQSGAQALLSTLKRGEYPHLDTRELGRAVEDPAVTEDVARSGEGFLSRMFGSKERGAVEGLASTAGVSSSSASKLLGLAAPLVLSFVGKEAVSHNMDASGLGSFLALLRRQVVGALPTPLAGMFGGLPARATAAGGPAATGPRALAHPYEPVDKPRGRIWLLVGLVALGILGLWMWRLGVRHVTSRPMTAPVSQSGSDMVAKPQTLFAGGLAPLSRALEGGQTLPQRFVLRDLTFRTDSAEIDSATAQVLDDVAQLLATHSGARIRVEGHTDDTGAREANGKLSQARAESTRAYLVGKGIAGDRVDAAGFGPDSALASNDTAAGRAENRRTEIVLISR